MKLFVTLFTLLLCGNAFSQTTCVNSGFESSQTGNYSNNPNGVTGWTVSSRGSTTCLTPSLSWTGGSPKFALLATPVIDGVIGTIPHSPLGGTVVALLNNATSPYYVTTRLAQTFSVTNANQYFNFAFAIASNDGTHQLCCENPACYFQLKDINGNVLSCFSESVAPSTTCASAVSQTVTGAWSYTNWKVRTFNLTGLVGSTVTFEAIVKDCNFGAHCGYMYFDAQCSNLPANCNCIAVNNASHVSLCAGSNQAIVNGPPGMTNYSWTAPSGVVVPSGNFTLAAISASNVTTGQVFTVTATSSAGCQVIQTYTLLYTLVGAGTQSVSASCLGGATGTATLFPTGSGHGYSFAWYNSTNSVVNTSSVAASLPPGTYSVNITALNAAGCGSVSTSVIIPSVGVSYSISNSGSSYSLCSGSSIVAGAAISGTAPSNAFTYSWSPAVFLASTNQQATLITPTAAIGGSATLIYSLVVTPTNVNCPHQQTVQIFVGNPVTPTLVPVSLLCSESAPVQITAAPPGGVFSGNPGLHPTGTVTPSLSATGTNLFSYSYTLAGCVKTASGSYTVNSSPQLTVSATPTICAGSTAVLTVAGADQYVWSTASNSQTVFVNPAVTTTYSVTGTNTLGNCTDSSVVTVSVSPVPALALTAPDSACAGQPAVLTAGGADSYQWNGSPGAASITSFPSVGVNSYTITGTYTSSGCKSVLLHTIQGISQPTLNLAGNFTLCAGETLSLSASGAMQYTWNNVQGGPTYTTIPFVNMLITLTGTSEGICHSSITKQVFVDPCTGIGGEQLSLPAQWYFDAAPDVLIVRNVADVRLELLDLQGKILYVKNPGESPLRLDMGLFSDGMYLLRFISERSIHIRKIVLDR